MEIKENVKLAGFTTLGVGGPARFFCEARVEDDVAEGVEKAASLGVPLFVLGGGSNLLIADEGVEGLVMHIALGGFDVVPNSETALVRAGAGETWDSVVEKCVGLGLAGIECLSAIPGLVGGTPVQNVGAYGQEISETLVSVRAFDRERGSFVSLSNSECGFYYRKSIFNSANDGRYVVVAVEYRLLRGGRPKLAYDELRAAVDPDKASLAEVRDAVIAIRRKKSMVIDPNDPNSRSAGSFFKNPIVEVSEIARITDKLRTETPKTFPAEAGRVKIPAAWLIEKCGFPKGYAMGNAGISANHSLAIINRGNARADEIFALKERIRLTVLDRTGISLFTEPILLGFRDR